MTPEQFPSDVPVPSPYEVEAPAISLTAVYRAEVERLAALGYAFDPQVVPSLRFYVAFSRAFNELERLQRMIVTTPLHESA